MKKYFKKSFEFSAKNIFAVFFLAAIFIARADSAHAYDTSDFSNLVTDWLKSISNSPADVNLDNKVNSRDLGIMMSHWEDSGTPPATTGCSTQLNGKFNSGIGGWQKNGISTIAWQNASSGDGSTGFLRFNIADNGDYDRFATNDGVNITSPNTINNVSFWYRTSGITGDLQVFSTDILDTLGETASWAADKITPSTSWKYFSTTLAVDSADYPVFGISKLGSVGAGTLDVDAISVCGGGGSSPTPTLTETCGNGTCAGSESCSSCSADCGSCPVPPSGSSIPTDYHLTFSDEFDGPTIDRGKWNTDYMGRWGDTSGNFSFNSGIFSIRGNGPEAGYSAGALDTMNIFSQKYGWFESRFRSRIGSGMHSAFWLMPADDRYINSVSNGGTRQDSNEAFEIDIFEQLGRDPHNNELTAHYGGGYDVDHQSDTIDYYDANIDFTKEFHTLALEWLPNQLIWYLDGNEVFRSDKAPQAPFYIISSLYAHSGWTGPWDPNQVFPVYYDTDYIRVYQKN